MIDSKNGKLEFLTDKNSALVLVDYQPSMFRSISSGDKTIIKSAAVCAAKAAKILGVPVVLSRLILNLTANLSQKLLRFSQTKRCMRGKCRALMLLKMRKLGKHSSGQGERSWLFLGFGQACALRTAPSMLSRKGTRFMD